MPGTDIFFLILIRVLSDAKGSQYIKHLNYPGVAYL